MAPTHIRRTIMELLQWIWPAPSGATTWLPCWSKMAFQRVRFESAVAKRHIFAPSIHSSDEVVGPDLRLEVYSALRHHPNFNRRTLPAMPADRNGVTRKTLAIGMATYDDYDGVYFTVQAIRLFHPEITADSEIIVVDNHPSGPC